MEMADSSLVKSISWRSVVFSIIVVLGHVISGAYNTFNLTMVTVRETFNYTQTEVEMIVSAVTLGFGTAMPFGICLDIYGPKWTSLIGLSTSVPGFAFLYLATLHVDFFRDKSWLFAILTFLTGQGFFILFSISWTTAARRADPRIRGIVFGTLKSFVLGSPVLFTILYESCFKNNNAIGNYMLFLLICFSAIDVIILLFLRDPTISASSQGRNNSDSEDRLAPAKDDKSAEIFEFQNHNNEDAINEHGEDSRDNRKAKRVSNNEESPLVPGCSYTQGHQPLWTLLRSLVFHCITWSVALALTSDTVVYGNIGVITQSAKLLTHSTELMILNRVLICCATFTTGLFLNSVHNQFVRCGVLTIAMGIVFISNVLLSSTTESSTVLTIGIALEGLGSGVIWVCGAAVTFTFCGVKDYGRNWGIVMMAVFLLSLIVSLMFGRMYDSKVIEPSQTCIGSRCTADWFYVLSAMSLLSVLLAAALCFLVSSGIAKPQ